MPPLPVFKMRSPSCFGAWELPRALRCPTCCGTKFVLVLLSKVGFVLEDAITSDYATPMVEQPTLNLLDLRCECIE